VTLTPKTSEEKEDKSLMAERGVGTGEELVFAKKSELIIEGLFSMPCLSGRRFTDCNGELGSCFVFFNFL
jgi:hypothetical protein